LHDRARLTREVEALVLAMEARLGVQGAADVLGIDATQVEAVLLGVATAETSELPHSPPNHRGPLLRRRSRPSTRRRPAAV